MSEPIRVGLLGCGGIQRKHARTIIEREDALIVGMCDPDQGSFDRLLDRLDNPEPLSELPRFSDPGQMYDEVEMDAVSICSPHTLHYEQGMAALNRGLHVLMEKPMVTSAAHAHEIAEKVRQSGLKFLVGYNTPCSPELAYIRDVLRKSELGQLELISGYLSQGWMKGTMGKWRQDPALSGGGQAYDSGSHLLASLCWTVEQRVEEVFAFIDNHGTQVDINSSINVKFENGTFASLAISGNCPGMGSHMAYLLTDGRIEFDPWNVHWLDVWRGSEKDDGLTIPGEPTAPADNFLDAIQGKAEVRADPENGVIHSELMDLIYESARLNRPVRREELAGVS